MRRHMHKLLYTAVAAALALPFVAASAPATAAPYTITAEIPYTCAVTAGSIAFADLTDGTAKTESMTIDTDCTGGTNVKINVSMGQNESGGERHMKHSSGETIQYKVCKDVNCSLYALGSATYDATVNNDGTAPIYLRIPAISDFNLLPAGTYSDTVDITTIF